FGQPAQLAPLLLQMLGVAGRLFVEPFALGGREPRGPHWIDAAVAVAHDGGNRREPHRRLVGPAESGAGQPGHRQPEEERDSDPAGAGTGRCTTAVT
ncbi:MAG: hypothetical protein ACK559_11000, partial [bacterium]